MILTTFLLATVLQATAAPTLPTQHLPLRNTFVVATESVIDTASRIKPGLSHDASVAEVANLRAQRSFDPSCGFDSCNGVLARCIGSEVDGYTLLQRHRCPEHRDVLTPCFIGVRADQGRAFIHQDAQDTVTVGVELEFDGHGQ